MTNSPPSRFAWLWWLVILLLLIANLIVLGGLLWLILSDLTLTLELKQAPLAQEALSFAPATSTLPPDATPEEARPLALVPVREEPSLPPSTSSAEITPEPPVVFSPVIVTPVTPLPSEVGENLALLATLTTQPTLVSPTATLAELEVTPTSQRRATVEPIATIKAMPKIKKSNASTQTSTPSATLSPEPTTSTSSSTATPSPTIDPVIAQAGAGSMTIGGALIVAPNLLPTSTATPLPTQSAGIAASATERAVPSQTSTTVSTNTATASAQPTNSPTASAQPTNSPTASVQPTKSPTLDAAQSTSTEPTNTPTNQPTNTSTITLAPATVPPTLLPTQEKIDQRQADVPTISISVVSNGVLLRWTAIAGEGYRIYSNMGSGLEMYRLLGETETGEWLDTSVQSGRSYHYQIIALSDKELSNPIEISITTPEWRWRSIGGQSRQVTEAIASPVPTPTLAPLRLTIASRTSYLDSAGDFHVIALLRNQEETDLIDLAVQINLLNDNQEIIQTVSGIPYVQEAASGATIPMHITIEDVEPKSYTIIATGLPGNASSLPLLIEASQGSEASDGLYYIEGRLRNRGDSRIDFPRIVVVLLDDSGRPVNAEEVRPIPAQIDPDSTATFQMRFDYYPRVVNHEVYALP